MKLDHLIRVEGVDAAGSPFRLIGNEGSERCALLDKALTQPRYCDIVPNLLIEPIDVRPGLLHCRDQLIGTELRTICHADNEGDEGVEIQIVGWHRRDDRSLPVRFLPHGARMTKRAIEPCALDALHRPAAQADWQIPFVSIGVCLIEKPEDT